MTVLTVSAVITVVALIFTARQAQQQRETQIQQARDDAVQAYFDQMSILLIENDLRTSPEDSEARTLARARTLTILSRLDPKRRSRILQFLLEAELVQRLEQSNPVINLSGANLSGVFVHADTNLSYADLSGTNLSDGILNDTNLSTAYLMAADLHHTSLSRATLSSSDLGLADLSDANLSNADLTQANLNDTVLTDTVLKGADLWGADLTDAEGVTKHTLVNQAGYVGQLTMPKGHFVPEQLTDSKSGEYPSGKLIPGILGMKVSTGEYISDEFVPAFHFEVDEGWEYGASAEATDLISLGVEVQVNKERDEVTSTEGDISFTKPSHVFAASNLSEHKKIPAPENPDGWVSWFEKLEKHSEMNASRPSPVSVGAASGKQIDTTLTTTPENYPQGCFQPCIDLYETTQSTFAAYADRTERFLILDVGEETVVVNVSAPADKQKEFFRTANKLLETVEWTGT